jgi:hypothetical protein
MEAVHTTPTAQVSEVAISREQVLSMFYELREELILCFMSKDSELAELLTNETW